MLVVGGDVVDQALVQRPGIELAFPVVDHRVAEAEHLALHVGRAGGDPGGAGGLEVGLVRLGEQGVDGLLQGLGGAQGIAEYRRDQCGVVADHRLGGSLVDARAGDRRRLRGGSRRAGLGRGLDLVVLAAAGECNGQGEQAGGEQRVAGHAAILVWTMGGG
ncbi:hypothetical protein D3C81_1254700 [compost metagenome]